MTVTGECFCGAIQYQVQGGLANARSCHCSRCRKVFGGAASAFAELADLAVFRWTRGEQNLRRYIGASGWGLGFCRTCGSALCGLHRGKVVGVTLGTVNGDPGVELTAHIYVNSRAPWDHIDGTIPRYAEGLPEQSQGSD